jgi:hypothetical protein
MALQRAKLGDIQYIASTAGSIYANPASTKTYVKGFILHNTNTTAETVKLYVVPDSAAALGTATTAHLILNISLPANDTLLVELPYALTLTDTNDSVQGVTTTASKVTVIVFGDKE